MILTLIIFTLIIALSYRAWSNASKEDRVIVLKSLCCGIVYSSVACVILFVIVNLF